MEIKQKNGYRNFQVGEVVTTIPTIGFNVEQVTYKNLKFQVFLPKEIVFLKYDSRIV